jgi:PilZ domain
MSEIEATPPPPKASRGVHCPACGRAKDCTISQLTRYNRKGLPWCCGEVMRIHGDGAVPTAGPQEKRIGQRRLALKGAQLEFRRGSLGLGADLAVEVIDISDDGLCVHLKEPMAPGEEAEVGVGRPLGGKLIKRIARVVWCRPAWGKGFLVEVVFSRRLSHLQVNDLVQTGSIH